ncbi:hypothetical protein BJ165DRAFT_1340174 [Panaeolus papilionaceus]|nr:hypothetical protein BJ165DRAFT_1340174 [Panaeolus papilionaceus]
MPSRLYEKLIKGLQRKQACIIFQLRSEHATLAKHLYTIGKLGSPTCHKCDRHQETVHHFLMQCAGYRREREEMMRSLGREGRSAGGIVKLLSSKTGMKALFRYINRTGRWRRTLGRFRETIDDGRNAKEVNR